MSIIYICRDCKGKGKVQRKLWIVTTSSVCRSCSGTGRRKHESVVGSPVVLK
jgi:DnaJ-class molecular chaperone